MRIHVEQSETHIFTKPNFHKLLRTTVLGILTWIVRQAIPRRKHILVVEDSDSRGNFRIPAVQNVGKHLSGVGT